MTKKEILISVALTTFNGEKYLKEQLDSIYSQSYRNIEVIVCDDGSTDKTVSILEEYRNSCGLKYFINETNLGYIKNFEKTCCYCSGDYIALSDQDDIWEVDKLAILLSEIKENYLIFSDMSLIDSNNTIIVDSAFSLFNVNPMRATRFKYMSFRNYVTGCTMMFSRKLLDYSIPFPVNCPHDYWLGLVAAHFGKISICRKTLTKYRQHEKNQIGTVLRPLLSDIRSNWVAHTDNKRILLLEELIKHEIFNKEEIEQFEKALSFHRRGNRKLPIRIYLYLRYFIRSKTKNPFAYVLYRVRYLRIGEIHSNGNIV